MLVCIMRFCKRERKKEGISRQKKEGEGKRNLIILRLRSLNILRRTFEQYIHRISDDYEEEGRRG